MLKFIWLLVTFTTVISATNNNNVTTESGDDDSSSGSYEPQGWDDVYKCETPVVEFGKHYTIKVRGEDRYWSTYPFPSQSIHLRWKSADYWKVEEGNFEGEMIFRIKKRFNAWASAKHNQYVRLSYDELSFLPTGHEWTVTNSGFIPIRRAATGFIPYCSRKHPGYVYLMVDEKKHLWIQQARHNNYLHFSYFNEEAKTGPPKTLWKFELKKGIFKK